MFCNMGGRQDQGWLCSDFEYSLTLSPSPGGEGSNAGQEPCAPDTFRASANVAPSGI
jgi:hypothetical protein